MSESAENKTQTFSKGEILIQAGDVCHFAYKVISGCLKSYVIDQAGKEHILQFAPEEWFISDLDSFIHGSPTHIFIEAIEDSEVELLNRPQLGSDEVSDELNLRVFNQKLLNNVIARDKRLISLLSANSEQRYLEFMQTYPSLVQRLPQKLIASYIGVTPEYLSEIRRKMVSK